MADYSKKRTNLLKRWEALKSERSSWMSHWMEISSYILPRNGRFFRSPQNSGERKHNLIYDSTGTRSLKILGAGLMAGATSPARPWFRLGTHDPELNTFQPVKVWLADVADRMHKVFQKSNTYMTLQQTYEELGAFGTGGDVIVPNFKTIIHHHPLTCGEYAIATDAQGNVCTLYREFQMTTGQMVKEFGKENCSNSVQSAFENGNLDDWRTVIHAIEPRADRDESKRDSKNMPFSSCYFELESQQDKVLRESGFRQLPAVVPRWALAGGDIYGNSPGMEALGDIKQLQHEQKRKAQGIDYKTNPPLQVPAALKNQPLDMLPGGVTYVEAAQQSQGIKSAFEVNLDLNHLLMDIQDVRQRIQQSFFTDLFLMIANSADSTKTATEIAMMQEEKMLMLGPVLERLNNELLYPLVDITFANMLEGGAVPPPPEELQGMDLNVEFISMLAQAQRAIGTNSVDRFVVTLGQVAAIKPEVLDKFDPDAWVDAYSDMLGVDPKLIVAADKVAMVRDARNKAQAAASQAQMMQQNSQTAKNLAQSPTQGPGNALMDVMNQFSGYQSPAPTEI